MHARRRTPGPSIALITCVALSACGPSPDENVVAGALQQSNLDVRTCDDEDAGEYCGTTNTQGLASNGLGNACMQFAAQPSDRFLHLEQTDDAASLVSFVVAGIEAALP